VSSDKPQCQMQDEKQNLDNKIYNKFNGTEFVRTQPSQTDIAITGHSQTDTTKGAQQSVDSDEVTSCQPVGSAFSGYRMFRSKV